MVISGVPIHRGHWLEHMFIAPEYIGRGIGSRMFGHLRDYCKKEGIQTVNILSDPNSRGFYEKMGCAYVKEFPSTIAHRTTPFLVLRR